MAIIVLLLAVAYFALFFIIAIYARRNGRSSLLWMFISLILTPIIAFIFLRGNIIQDQKKQARNRKISSRNQIKHSH